MQESKEKNTRNIPKMKIATFNIQGGNAKQKKQDLADDFENYKLDAILTTETRISGNEVEEIKTPNGKKLYHYTPGLPERTRYGVGIIISQETQAEFKEVSDRICKMTIRREKMNPI